MLRRKPREDGFLKTLKHTPEKEMMLGRLSREIKIQESLYVFLLVLAAHMNWLLD